MNAYGMGVAVGDYDNDGLPDVYVTNLGENALLHNEGGGKFKDVTRAARVGDPRWSTGAAFLDYDRDGDLDLFVTSYVDFTVVRAPCGFESTITFQQQRLEVRDVVKHLIRQDNLGTGQLFLAARTHAVEPSAHRQHLAARDRIRQRADGRVKELRNRFADHTHHWREVQVVWIGEPTQPFMNQPGWSTA